MGVIPHRLGAFPPDSFPGDVRASRRPLTSSGRGQFSLLITVAAITGVAVALGAAIGNIGSAESFWLVILWGAWTVSTLWTFTRPCFSLPFAVILAGMLIYVIIPATIHVVSGRTLIAGDNFGAGTTRALEISALAQCATFAGALIARGWRPAVTLKRIHEPLDASNLDKAAWIALGLGFLGLLIEVGTGGGNLHNFFFFSQGGYLSYYTAAGTSGLFLGLQLIGGLALVLAVLRLTLATQEASRFVPVLIIALSAVLLLGIGQRGRLLVPALAAGLVWYKTTRRTVPPRTLAVGALLAVFAFSTVIGVFRQPAGQRQLSATNLTFEAVGGGTELFAPLAGLAQTVPAQVPYLNGSSYLETFVFPVPRALWHSKPTGTIKRITSYFDPRQQGLAFPEFGEMYANFGFLGVVVGSILFAWFAEWLWLRLAATSNIREAVLVSVVFAVLAQIFVRGSIAGMLVIFLGLLIVTAFVCRRRSKIFVTVPQASTFPGRR